MGKPEAEMIVIIRDRVRMRESGRSLHHDSTLSSPQLPLQEEEEVTTLLGALKAEGALAVTSSGLRKSLHSRFGKIVSLSQKWLT